MNQNEDFITLPIVYTDMEDKPILFANQFVIQHQKNEFVLTVGQLQPPILLGSPEERKEQVKKLTYVPIKVVARFGLTRQRLVELVEALQTNLRKYDEKQEHTS